MAIRRRTGLIGAGIAALLLLAVIFCLDVNWDPRRPVGLQSFRRLGNELGSKRK
jgi:hypothetical protein